MRALLITPEIIRRAGELAAWADRPENWYRPGEAPPGDNPAHVLEIPKGFRAVYSVTVIHGRRHRHLTVSVDATEKFPHPYCAWTMASWFGFTGGRAERDAITAPGPDWQMAVSREERRFTIGQEITEGTPCAP